MTTLEVVADLRSRGKAAYAGKVDQAYFSGTLSRIENELAKRSTIKQFFGKFGYEGDHDTWVKKSSAPWANSTPKVYQ